MLIKMKTRRYAAPAGKGLKVIYTGRWLKGGGGISLKVIFWRELESGKVG